MRTSRQAVCALVVLLAVLAGLAFPGPAAAVVVVRHPSYRPVATVVAVAVVVSIVSKPPPATPPPPPTAPPPPPVTNPIPIDTTMWQLPSDCLKMTVEGQTYYQCGPSWLVPQQCEQGGYYQVVPPPSAPPKAQ